MIIVKRLPVLLVVLGAACASSPAKKCDIKRDALTRLIGADWREIHPLNIANFWPTPLTEHELTATPVNECGGAQFLRSAGTVEAGEHCRCCQTFLFEKVASPTGCEDRLQAITLMLEASSEEEADAIVRAGLKPLIGDARLPTNDSPISAIVAGERRVIDYTTTKRGALWRLWLHVSSHHI